MAGKINSFVATLEEVMRFLNSYENDIFYFDINPQKPPEGARTFDITTFPPQLADQVLPTLHPSPNPPRTTPQAQALIDAAPKTQFACGMNIHPYNRQGYPDIPPDLVKVGWVRFPILASPARFPSVDAAWQFYDRVIDAYFKLGVKIMLVLTHELFGEGVYNWNEMDSNRWREFTERYAQVAEPMIKRYKGKVQAYEVWNEGDVEPGNPAAVAIPPNDYARFLTRIGGIIRQQDPAAKVIFQGLVKGTGASTSYLRAVKNSLGGKLPVDAIGVHPYGKGAPGDTTVFSRFGSIETDIVEFNKVAPGIPLWLTEVGALGTHDPNYWDDAALYMRNLFRYVREKRATQVPVIVWYAWSDAMDIAQKTNGLVTIDGKSKPPLYETFFDEACRNG